MCGLRGGVCPCLAFMYMTRAPLRSAGRVIFPKDCTAASRVTPSSHRTARLPLCAALPRVPSGDILVCTHQRVCTARAGGEARLGVVTLCHDRRAQTASRRPPQKLGWACWRTAAKSGPRDISAKSLPLVALGVHTTAAYDDPGGRSRRTSVRASGRVQDHSRSGE